MTEEMYFRIIKCKTAALISATCRLSAIVAKMEPEKQDTLAQFGLQLGLAYQIVDDTLDYIGDKQILGKSLGKDLRDGEITLPLLHLISSCGKGERKKVEEALRMNELSQKALLQILNFMKQYKSIEYSMNKARESVEAAKVHLFSYPDSIHRQALLYLTDYVISRDH
jgi:octaprenyl-diphosphate synthase